MKELGHAEIDIQAPAEHVWSILMNSERYHEWNTFTPRIDGKIALAETIVLHVNLRSDKLLTTTEVISQLDPSQMCVAWALKSPRWLINAMRVQCVQPTGENTCRYTTHEDAKGLFGWLVVLTNGEAVSAGFKRVAQDLKRRSETTWQSEPATNKPGIDMPGVS